MAVPRPRGAMEINPSSSGQWASLGMALNKLKRRNEGLQCLQDSVNNDPKNLPPMMEKGCVLYDSGRSREAAGVLEDALVVDASQKGAFPCP